MENDSKKNLKAEIEKLNGNIKDMISLIDENEITTLENKEEESIDEEVVLYEKIIKIGDAGVIEINMQVDVEK